MDKIQLEKELFTGNIIYAKGEEIVVLSLPDKKGNLEIQTFSSTFGVEKRNVSIDYLLKMIN